MFRRLVHALKGPNPLHPDVVDRPVPPVRFRRYSASDKAECLDLYRANETGRFPKDDLQSFQNALAQNSGGYLVGELEGKIVLSCGLHYWGNPTNAVLFYSLIAPAYQRRGLGVAMVLARLAMLRTDIYGINVIIFAVTKSLGYYERFGFRRREDWITESGEQCPSAVLNIYPLEVVDVRDWLAKKGIVYPTDESQVPTLTMSTQELEETKENEKQ